MIETAADVSVLPSGDTASAYTPADDDVDVILGWNEVISAPVVELNAARYVRATSPASGPPANRAGGRG